MSNKRYTEEFKAEALKQILERGYPVQEVSDRLGVSSHTLYKWLKKARGSDKSKEVSELEKFQLENARLKAELKRVEEERDILKKAAAYFAKASE
jgi:transposase